MSDAEILVAKAQGYAKSAKKMEDTGNTERAISLYREGARAYLDAAKRTHDRRKREERLDFAQMLYLRAEALSPHKTREYEETEEKTLPAPMEKPNITFDAVAGLEDVKEEIRQAIIYPLKHPEIFEIYKVKAGGGILLYGPPGCGKTFIAKATAGEVSASFYHVKLGEILSKWFGESEERISGVFEAARDSQPSIVFFDEIDAIGTKRTAEDPVIGRVVNALLTEMDGIESIRGEKILILGATNQPWALDPALRRSGRFSRILLVPPPDLSTRKKLFEIYMRGRLLGDVDLSKLAERTEGYSASDIADICEIAAKIPLKEAINGGTPRKIAMNDFESAIDGKGSSIIPWFSLAKREIEKSGEADVFRPLLEIAEKYGGK